MKFQTTKKATIGRWPSGNRSFLKRKAMSWIVAKINSITPEQKLPKLPKQANY